MHFAAAIGRRWEKTALRAAWNCCRRCLLPALCVALAALSARAQDAGPGAWRLPGEFERQEALLLGWDPQDPPVQEVVARIAAALGSRVPPVLVVPTKKDRRVARAALSRAGVPASRIRIVQAPCNTVWVRDYAPIAVRQHGGLCRLVDADYIAEHRRGDDQAASALGPAFGLPVVHVPLILEGGNLLSNGRGLIVTTMKLLDDNSARDYSAARMRSLLYEAYGAAQVVYLEPLVGEMTGHVDMFATFTAADTVVIAGMKPTVDRINAEILDRNAARLAAVAVGGKPLRVVRAPMPPRAFEVWRSYTNVVYANGALLVPSYATVDPEGHAAAAALYRELLPGWTAVGVDCEPIARIGGALRCVTANLARVDKLPPPETDSQPD